MYFVFAMIFALLASFIVTYFFGYDTKNDNLPEDTTAEKPARKGEKKTVYAPLSGKVLPLDQIPDPVFAQGVMGPGCGIEPSSETVCAPFAGTVSMVAATKHAVGLTSEDGMEVLIHIGLDTVNMNGQGFETHVTAGQKVNLGDKLITFSAAEIEKAGYSRTVAVILTNADEAGQVSLKAEETVQTSDVLLSVD
ncbi:MAG: PTS glucose transporter subunit IIA [Atopobium minutum]|nr:MULTISPECIES: PTS glucose transporter subunit IIA [Atopobium]MBS4874085.1 PTS glucose transporter subunit IIA [Atopobium minutum]MDU4970430.1 PTS glucose transporter subunit IIA [Atopobium minutum]MDU5357703.1 PTS glucose transporter subunit IIA [Atopobium minutum]MDU5893784.1 PTS glucose transporter subunit IIA [Atopobium minutum]